MKLIYSVLMFLLLGLVTSTPWIDDDPVVLTKLGFISGRRIQVQDKLIDQYLGIPFAKPLTKEFRYKKPEPISKYDTIVEATTMPPSCPQISNPLTESFGIPLLNISEDCLYLNIWNPVSTAEVQSLKVVMVWIYGGAFQMGGIDTPFYNGGMLSSAGDVIVVSMNYRLGSFGFFTSGDKEEPGNLGLYDQNLALQWIKQNIDYFGGDPEKITIFGESAGGMSVAYHTISPKSEGLFQRAILQSGTHLTPLYYTNTRPLIYFGLNLAKKVGCASGNENFQTNREEILNCLRSKEMNELLDKEAEIKQNSFIPLYGEDFLPIDRLRKAAAYLNKDIDILVGANEEEGNLMLLTLVLNKDFTNPYKMMKKTEALQVATELVGKEFKNPEKLTAPYFENVEENDVIGSRQAFSDIITDGYFVCPAILYANDVAENDGHAYLYFFTHYSKKPSPLPDWLRSTHAMEIFYVFGIPADPLHEYPEMDVEFSKHMMTLWTNFAKEGKIQNWKPYELKSDIAFELNPLRNSSLEVPRSKRCYDLWVPALYEKLERTTQ